MSTEILDLNNELAQRRRFLLTATSSLGLIGISGLIVPFIASMKPSEKAKGQGAPVQVDISKLQPGEQITLLWRGKPVWVLRRTPVMLKRLTSVQLLSQLRDPESTVQTQQPKFAQNAYRAINSEYFVTIALCTHLGCTPSFRPEIAPEDLGASWPGGYYCPCHGSRFDLAGRVYKGVPAPTNLVIPPYQFLSETVIEIGTSRSA